MMFKTIEAGLL